MKWHKKQERWERPYYIARYKNPLLTVSEYTKGWEKTVLGYYFSVTDKKADKSFNSLWKNTNLIGEKSYIV